MCVKQGILIVFLGRAFLKDNMKISTCDLLQLICYVSVMNFDLVLKFASTSVWASLFHNIAWFGNEQFGLVDVYHLAFPLSDAIEDKAPSTSERKK